MEFEDIERILELVRQHDLAEFEVESDGMPYGFSGVMTGAAVVFFAYIGFDAVSTTAEEAKNPSRDLPIGIIASLVICTLLYLIVAGILSGIVPVVQFKTDMSFADTLKRKIGRAHV